MLTALLFVIQAADTIAVTLHQIVRMRRFTRVAAANLRIISHEIIKYAAITITPQIAAKWSVA